MEVVANPYKATAHASVKLVAYFGLPPPPLHHHPHLPVLQVSQSPRKSEAHSGMA
jgi:hypothetical protein